jgi:predicted dinucleotide-binding enzyme
MKTFNNLSAYALLHGDPLTKVMKSVAASDNRAAAEAVAALGRAMGLEVSRQLLFAPARHGMFSVAVA